MGTRRWRKCCIDRIVGSGRFRANHPASSLGATPGSGRRIGCCEFKRRDPGCDVVVNEDPIPDSTRLRAAVDELIQKNFEDSPFVSAAQIDREAAEIRLLLLQPPLLVIPAVKPTAVDAPPLNEGDAPSAGVTGENCALE